MQRFAGEINACISAAVDATHDDLARIGIPREQLARATTRVRASVTGKMATVTLPAGNPAGAGSASDLTS